ncbi:caspase family protein [Saccharothrix sp. NPDC042600]|uniref:caspase family protein n=1 Tax=Saccharothrix TaxID=2071 RepID=UPI0033C07D85
MRRYLITAGTRHYLDAEELPSVPEDLEQIGAAFTELGYAPALRLLDPDTDVLRRALGSWAREVSPSEDALVVYYTGHGERDGFGHFLLCADSESSGLMDTALRTEDIAMILTSHGVRRLLIIVDTCYAAAGTVESVRRMAELLRAELMPRADNERRDPVDFAVVAAARTRETAEQGVFARAFRSALRKREFGDRRQPYLRLEDVVNHVNRQFERDGVLQHATLSVLAGGSGFGFLPNPRHPEWLPPEGVDLAEQEVQWRQRRRELADHFGPRGRGNDTRKDVGNYFVGRVAVLRELAGWLRDRSGQESVVVTGKAGAGKSAVLGRLAALADAETRAGLSEGSVPTGTDPGVGAVDVAIHVRHKTLADVVAGIGAAAGVSVTSVDQLIAALRGRQEPLVVLVDALDEAGSVDTAEPERIATLLLKPLANVPGVRLLVGARPHVVDACGPGFRVLDLDEPRWVAREDLAEYARMLLLAPHGPGSSSAYDETTAAPIAEDIAGISHPNYLLARVIAQALAKQGEVISALPGWQRELPAPGPDETRVAGPAFRWALARQFGDEESWARMLLMPLAFAEGEGVPWGQVWPAMAAALAGQAVGSQDIEWLLTRSDRHIVEVKNAQDRSVYRLYHESYADELRRTESRHAQSRIVDALLGLVPGRDWQAADPYIQAHLATHAAACSRLDELMVDPGFLLIAQQAALRRGLATLRRKEAVAAGAAYVHCAHLLEDSTRTVEDRAAALLLSARAMRAKALARSLWGMPGLPWRTLWADIGQDSGVRPIGLHEHEVTAVGHVRLNGILCVVTGDAAGGVHVWEFHSGRRLHQLSNVHRSAVLNLTTLDEHGLIVSVDTDAIMVGWHPTFGTLTGPPIRTGFTQPGGLAATFVDGEPVAAYSAGKHVAIWNLSTGQRLTKQRISWVAFQAETNHLLAFMTWQGYPALLVAVTRVPDPLGHSTKFRAVLLTLDGKVVDHRNHADVWGICVSENDGKPTLVIARDRSHWGFISSEPWSVPETLVKDYGLGRPRPPGVFVRHADDALVAVRTSNGIALWGLEDGRQRGYIDTPARDLTGFAVAGTTWLAAADALRVQMFELGEWDALAAQQVDMVVGIAMSQAEPGRVVVARRTSSRQAVFLHRLGSGTTEKSWSTKGILIDTIIAGGLDDAYSPLVVREESSYGGSDVVIEDLDSGSTLWRHQIGGRVWWTRSHHLLVVEGDFGAVSIFDDLVVRYSTNRSTSEFPIPHCYAAAALAVDGRPLVFACHKDRLTAYDADLGTEVWSAPGELRVAGAGTGWDGDRPIIITGGMNLRGYDARTGEPLGEPMRGHALPPSVIEFGRIDGRTIVASGGGDQTVRVWDFAAARQLALIDVRAEVTAIRFGPGTCLVIGTRAGLLRVDLAIGVPTVASVPKSHRRRVRMPRVNLSRRTKRRRRRG